MRTLRVEKRSLDFKALRFRPAVECDYNTLISDEVRVEEGGELRLVYLPLSEEPADLLAACRGIDYYTGARSGGLVSRSLTLGFRPRVTIRKDYCTAAAMAEQFPAHYAVFQRYCRSASAAYQFHNPEQHAAHAAQVEKVLPEWRIPGSVFTSGIVNWDNPLRYHTDTGNFPGVWSCMYALSHDCLGGHLVLPEYRLGFSFQRPALIMFNGQGRIHGVSPLRKRSRDAYRYSVVFYALQQMCRCLPVVEELARIRSVKTTRERKRGGLIEQTAEERRMLLRAMKKDKEGKVSARRGVG